MTTEQDQERILAAVNRLFNEHQDWEVEFEFEYSQPDEDCEPTEALVNIDIYGSNATPELVDQAIDQVGLEIIWEGNIKQDDGDFVYTRQCVLKHIDALDMALERFLANNRTLAIAASRPTPDTMLIEVMHGEGLTQPMLDHTYSELGRVGFTLTSVTHHRDPEMGLSTRTEILVR